LKIAAAFLSLIAFSFLALAADPIWIQGSPNFTAENQTINLSFTLVEATGCNGNIDADVAFEDMPISFSEVNGTFSTSIASLPIARHDVFIRCVNENRLESDPAFYYSFLVLLEEDMPDKVEQRTKFYAPPGSQPRTSPSDSSPGVTSGEQTQKPTFSNNSNVVQPLLPPQQTSGANTPVATQLTALAVSASSNWLALAIIAVLVVAGYAYYKFKKRAVN